MYPIDNTTPSSPYTGPTLEEVLTSEHKNVEVIPAVCCSLLFPMSCTNFHPLAVRIFLWNVKLTSRFPRVLRLHLRNHISFYKLRVSHLTYSLYILYLLNDERKTELKNYAPSSDGVEISWYFYPVRYETVHELVPAEHRKFIRNIHKRVERGKRKKMGSCSNKMVWSVFVYVNFVFLSAFAFSFSFKKVVKNKKIMVHYQ